MVSCAGMLVDRLVRTELEKENEPQENRICHAYGRGEFSKYKQT